MTDGCCAQGTGTKKVGYPAVLGERQNVVMMGYQDGGVSKRLSMSMGDVTPGAGGRGGRRQSKRFCIRIKKQVFVLMLVTRCIYDVENRKRFVY